MPKVNPHAIGFTHRLSPKNGAEIQERLAELSPRAQALYKRLHQGAWYYTYAEKTPVSMKELIAARLVTTGARYPQMHSCYVPTDTLTINTEAFYTGYQIDPEHEQEIAGVHDRIRMLMSDLDFTIKKLNLLKEGHRILGGEQESN